MLLLDIDRVYRLFMRQMSKMPDKNAAKVFRDRPSCIRSHISHLLVVVVAKLLYFAMLWECLPLECL